MTVRRLSAGAFVLLCLVQLYVAASGIAQHELTLARGHRHRFVTAPVDPEDPLRGRYLRLAFAAERVVRPLPAGLDGGPLYAWLERDARGFSTISKLSAQPPPEHAGVDYLRVDSYSVLGMSGPQGRERPEVRVSLPFGRYFLQEGLARYAEAVYRERAAAREGAADDYLVVRVLDGHAVAEQLFVDGQPIEELAAARRAQ